MDLTTKELADLASSVPTAPYINNVTPSRSIYIPPTHTDKETAKLIQHFQSVLVHADDLLGES